MHEGIHYERHYLTKVIARVDFPSPIDGIDTRLPKEVSQEAMKRFPIAEPKPIVTRQIHASLDDISSSKGTFTQWDFHGKERDKTLTINPTAVLVQYSSYESYEVLRDDFVGIVSAVFAIHGGMQASRLGLRYINNIALSDGDPLSWEDYLDSRVLCLFDFAPERGAIARVFHNMEFNFGDFNLRYQFGMHNPDFPAPIRRKVYVLDLDAYYQGPLERPDIEDHLDMFHERIQDFFELTITAPLRRRMDD